MEYITDESLEQMSKDMNSRFGVDIAIMRSTVYGCTVDFNRPKIKKESVIEVCKELEHYCASKNKMPAIYYELIHLLLDYVTPEFHKLLSDYLAKANV